MGGRISLSSEASSYLMEALHSANEDEVEIAAIQPLLKLQEELSSIPGKSQLLMEYFESKEGYHLFVFPFEGRLVHEGLGLITAYRLAQIRPFTFSIAMNDYGFELLSDQPIPVEDGLETDLFQPGQLLDDIQKSINLSEMARRKFRDIAAISGLTFKGYPQRMQKDRHLQASASLFFDVFSDYDRSNLLLQQAYEEVLFQQLEENRLRAVLQRMSNQEVVLKYLKRPSPFCFPIMVDRLNRAQLSNESIEDRIRKMIPDS
jgi:ATP-dependent Lhr-like helicase